MDILGLLRKRAREVAKRDGVQPPTQEIYTHYVLEGFLARLAASPYREDFVLKGGLLLGVYTGRRFTKDIDSNAVSATVNATELRAIATNIAQIDIGDGVMFDPGSLTTREIREADEYPGIRLKMPAQIDSWKGVFAWDVSTGDPIVPAAQWIVIPHEPGEPMQVLSYPPEAIMAEKVVTMLERGITSTRWKDYVDILDLYQSGLDENTLIAAVKATAKHRGIAIRSISGLMDGYGDVYQSRWAAWRKKESMEEKTETDLDNQLARIATVIDPVLVSAAGHDPTN